MTASGFPVLPVVTTDSVSDISQNDALSGGNVISDGGTAVTARGVCWSTYSNPTYSDAHTSNKNGPGNFISNITGLTANTPYYVRAYATNNAGTSYGNQVGFTTTGPCPGMPTITDWRDGQVYPTVLIGSQCWLQKNMNYITGNSWCYENYSLNCNTYGRLYDWQTALGACPSGWHLPSDSEWTALTDFLGGDSIAGGKMKEAGTAHWELPNTDATNSSGFTALPGGIFDIEHSLTFRTYFWSSTESPSPYVWTRGLGYDEEDVYRCDASKTKGLSVRCVHD
jgi:uncharacterized protein (TIGR02145 family)